MREILFRGKKTISGEWVEGGYYENDTGKYVITPAFVAHLVDPETVGQYTGLTDKNGVRIFEGDIVKVKSWHVVVFEDGAFGLKAYNKIKPVSLMGHANKEAILREIEVIGNIYDNPELLNPVAKDVAESAAQQVIMPAT